MTFQTRPSIDTDYNWLFSLHRTSYFEVIMRQFGGWDENEQLSFFLHVWKSKKLTILTKNEQPMGMFLLNEYDDHLWLAELQIKTQYQNTGIGSKVIQMLLIKARALDFPLRLKVLHENHGAERLYLREGFCRIDNTAYHHVMEAT